MSKVAVVYHSGYGHTAAVAKAVARGAAGVEGVQAQLVSVADIDQHWDALKAADAIIKASRAETKKHLARMR